MHCYKSEGTRLSVSQVRLPLGRKGDNHWAIIGELGGKKILRDPWSLFQSSQCLHAVLYHSLTFREGGEGKKENPQPNQSQERNKWSHVDQMSSGFSKAPCLRWAGNISLGTLFRRGTAQKHQLKQFLGKETGSSSRTLISQTTMWAIWRYFSLFQELHVS